MKKHLLGLGCGLLLALVTLSGCGPKNDPSTGPIGGSDGPISDTSNPIDSSTGGSTTSLATALAADYSNMTVEVICSWNNGEDSELFVEYYDRDYTIVYSPEYADMGVDPYLYYHDYEGESYLYFTDDYGNGDAWLKEGYRDAPLGLENTYFSWAVAHEKLVGVSATFSSGMYMISDAEVVAELNSTMFYFAYENDVEYVLISVNNSHITQIIGLCSLENEDDYVRIRFSDFGETAFAGTLPPAPNADNVMTYYEFSGTSPIVDKPITSLSIALPSGEDGVLEIEEEIEVTSSYLPTDATETTLTWMSTEEGVVEFDYSWTPGARTVTALAAGTTEIYAVAPSGVASNRISITVNDVPDPTLTGKVYDLDFVSISGSAITVSNGLNNNKPITATGAKASVVSGQNGTNQWTGDDQLLVLNPSENGIGGAYIEFDLGEQEVSGISFYYGLQWNDVSNLSRLSTVEIQEYTPDGDAEWTTVVDFLDEFKANASGQNLKLFQKEFEPMSHFRIYLYLNMTGTPVRFATSHIDLYANAHCHQVDGSEIEVTGVTLSASNTDLLVGDTTTISASVAPDNATNKTLTWASSNPDVASVSEEGVVTAVAAGTSVITATSANGVVSNSITINVADRPVYVAVTSVTIAAPASTTLQVDETLNLQATVAPSNATNQALTWTSSAPAVASVSANGVVTALSAGSVEIYATATDDEVVSNRIALTITAKPEPVALPDEMVGTWTGSTSYGEIEIIITKNEMEGTMAIDSAFVGTADLEYVEYDSAEEHYVFSDSSYTAYAYLSGEGLCVLSDDLYIDCDETNTLTRVIEAASISIATPETTSITVNSTITLSATVLPSNAINTSVTWSSSNTSVATVSSAGVVTGRSVGTSTITARTSNGLTDSITITVTPQSTTIQVPADAVGEWIDEMDYSVYETITFIINDDGTANLSFSIYDVDFTLVEVREGVCVFEDADGATLTFSYADGQGYIAYSGSDFEIDCESYGCYFEKTA